MAKRILHLTLLKKWFDQIARGEKTVEYRELSKYWIGRLIGKRFDEIHFRNGYRKTSPFMRVECIGITANVATNKFEIKLGRILEIRNWSGTAQ